MATSPTAAGRRRRPLWPLAALAVPAALMVWSGWIIAGASERRGLNGSRAETLRKLEGLEGALLDLARGSVVLWRSQAASDSVTRWKDLYRNYRAHVQGIDGNNPAVQEIMDALLRMYAAVGRTERIRQQLLITQVPEEEARVLETEFRAKIDLALAELKGAAARLQRGAEQEVQRSAVIPYAAFAGLAAILAIPLLLALWKREPAASGQPVKNGAERARAAERHARMLLDLSPDPMLLVDERAAVHLANAAAVKLLGFSSHELKGFSVATLLPGAGESKQGPALLEDLRNKAPMRTRARNRAGALIDVDVIWTSASAGEEKAAALVIREVRPTPAEESLRRERDLLDDIIDSAGLMVVVLDGEGRVLSMNGACELKSGLKETGACGKLFSDLFPLQPLAPGGQPEDWRKAIVCGVSELSVESVRRRIVWQVVPLLSPEPAKGRAVAVGVDVDGFVQPSRPAAADALGRLPARVAQTFGDALTTISGYSELLLQSMKPEDPLRKDVEQISQASERALQLTARLLAFSERRSLNPRLLDINETILAFVRRMRPRLAPLVTISPHLDANLKPALLDPRRLEDALLALIWNAVEAMPGGGAVVIRTALLGDGWMSLTVADNGAGIEEGTRSRLFDPLFTTKDPRRALGLGLSTVEGFVSESGGNVRLDRAPEGGAQAVLFLPLAPEPSRAAEPQPDASKDLAPSGH